MIQLAYREIDEDEPLFFLDLGDIQIHLDAKSSIVAIDVPEGFELWKDGKKLDSQVNFG